MRRYLSRQGFVGVWRPASAVRDPTTGGGAKSLLAGLLSNHRRLLLLIDRSRRGRLCASAGFDHVRAVAPEAGPPQECDERRRIQPLLADLVLGVILKPLRSALPTQHRQPLNCHAWKALPASSTYLVDQTFATIKAITKASRGKPWAPQHMGVCASPVEDSAARPLAMRGGVDSQTKTHEVTPLAHGRTTTRRCCRQC